MDQFRGREPIYQRPSTNSATKEGWQGPTSPFSPYPLPRPAVKSQSLTKVTLFKGISIVVLCLGLLAAFFVYIWIGRLSWNINKVTTTSPQGSVLLICEFVSKAVLTVVPVAMSLAAYHIADGWLRSSHQAPHDAYYRSNLPSPYQYALLLKLFQAADIFSLWSFIKYTKRRPSGSRAYLPKPLVSTSSILLILLLLAYAIFAVDLGIHKLSKTTLVLNEGPTDRSLSMYGFKLTDYCQWQHGVLDGSCTVTSGGTIGTHIMGLQNAMRIVGGTSNNVSVVSIDAILPDNNRPISISAFVPSNPDPTLSFTAKTIGQFAECDILTPSCQIVDNCMSCFNYTCANVGWPGVYDMHDVDSMGAFAAVVNRVDTVNHEANGTSGADTNPFPIAAVVALSECDGSGGNSEAGGNCKQDSGWFVSMYGANWMMLNCSISVVDLTVTYTNGSYTVENYQLSDNATTRSVSNPIDSTDWDSYFPPLLVPYALGGDSNSFARGFEAAFTKLLLPFSQWAFESAPVLSQRTSESVLATTIPSSLLIAYFILVLVFVGFAIALTMTALIVSKESILDSDSTGKTRPVALVELAAERLREPTALVSEYFEPGAAGSRTARSGVGMFTESRGVVADGVGLGVDQNGQFRFIRNN